MISTAILALLLIALPANAVCEAQMPIIGTVGSATTQGDYSQISLDNVYMYNASTFPSDRTNIGLYNALASAYAQHNDQLPQSFLPSDTASPSANYTSMQEYVRQNYSDLRIDTSALNTIAYSPGDIVILGPPGGASCIQYGFTGFFGKSGIIRSAIAYDSSYASYTYGSETLSLQPGTAYACKENSFETTCTVPLTYVVNGNGAILSPGELKILSGSKFSQVALIQSTHTTLQNNANLEDFYPQQLLHTMSFGTAILVAQPIVATSTAPVLSESCPTLSHNLGRGSQGSDVLALQTFLISQSLLGTTSATAYFGPLTERAVQLWQSMRGIAASGSPATTGYGFVGPKTRAALVACNAF